MKLRVGGVPEHFNLPWRLALENGAFERQGLDVIYTDYPGGTGAMTAALAAGELDAALLLTEGAVYDIVNGSDNCIVKIYVESPLTWGIHVPAGCDIAKVEDIEGRPVAISRYGSGSHLIAIVDAVERGFQLDAMQFVVVENLEGARRAFAEGRADVFLWEKHMTQPLVDAGEFRRVGERIVPWPAFVVSARRELVSKHPDDLRLVLDTIAQYARQVASAEDTAIVVSKRYGIDEADAARWLTTVRWGESYEAPVDAIRTVCSALYRQGAIADPEPQLATIWQSLRNQ